MDSDARRRISSSALSMANDGRYFFGAIVGSVRAAGIYSSATRSVVQPSSSASAASQPSLTPAGGVIVTTDFTPISDQAVGHVFSVFLACSVGIRPDDDSRSRSGDQSALSAALLPFGLVTVT